MNRTLASALVSLAATALPAAAAAHVDVGSGPGFAGKSQVITFAVGHGCEGADTSSVRIELPPEVSSVRAVPSEFGAVAVERDASDRVVAVTWTKPDAELLPQDEAYYTLALRIGVPNAPFSTIYFPTRQICKRADGTTLSTDWIARPGEEGEPAPGLRIVPARVPGWNRMTVPSAIDSLESFFADAQIVWRGEAAFSSNEHTAAQIAATPGVSALSSLAAGDEIWVKY